ncbi:MAG: radical SAM protein [Polyangiaceae bacterium]|nr:radical SAM protein [Polyangiaceae bacterium]
MDLHEYLEALVAPGDVMPGARLVGTSSEHGPRLIFELKGARISVEVAPADEAAGSPKKHAARSERLLFSYRADGVLPIDSKLGAALCRAVAARAAAREKAILAALEAETARSSGSARLREVRVTKLLEPDGAGFYYSLSPYVGCLIGCRFCYAEERIAGARRLLHLAEAPWGSFVDVRVNAAEVLARELIELPPLPVKFCPIVSDPYHAAEARFGITRACLTALRDAPSPFPTLVLTRARLIERDIDLLAAIPVAFAGASIPTVDDEVRRHFEPRGAPIDDRLGVLQKIGAAGVKTFAVVQPILPGPLEPLADALAGVISSARVDVLNGVGKAEAEFSDERYAMCRSDGWQMDRARMLREMLSARGVQIWEGELPPELMGGVTRAETPPPRDSK